MKRIIAILLATSLLASCGGGGSRSGEIVMRSASGPISTACEQAARKGASAARCGCVQAVANDSLSRSDQRLGASFFQDPHRAQEIRQSRSKDHAAFWERWKAFGDAANKICS